MLALASALSGTTRPHFLESGGGRSVPAAIGRINFNGACQRSTQATDGARTQQNDEQQPRRVGRFRSRGSGVLESGRRHSSAVEMAMSRSLLAEHASSCAGSRDRAVGYRGARPARARRFTAGGANSPAGTNATGGANVDGPPADAVPPAPGRGGGKSETR